MFSSAVEAGLYLMLNATFRGADQADQSLAITLAGG